MGPSLLKGWERAMHHLLDGHYVPKLTVQATKQCEDHLLISDGITELGVGGGHGLEAVTIVGDVPRALAKIAELRLEECMGFALAEELALEEMPGTASGELAKHQRL
jgi:hypothetical protein